MTTFYFALSVVQLHMWIVNYNNVSETFATSEEQDINNEQKETYVEREEIHFR